MGHCSQPACPFNHSFTQREAPGIVNPGNARADSLKNQTGSNGRFVGTRKGGNAVPIKQTGDVPAFMRLKLACPSVSTSQPTATGVRTGGNEIMVKPTGVLAHVPIQRPEKNNDSNIDWKQFALTVAARKSSTHTRKLELENELTGLIQIESEKQRALQEIEGELRAMTQHRDTLVSCGYDFDMKLVQESSVELKTLMDRFGAFESAVDEERSRANRVFDLMESTGLVDLQDLRKAQSLVLDEISEALNKFRKLSEYNFTEFKIAVHNARKARS
jgi:hypothetical protein